MNKDMLMNIIFAGIGILILAGIFFAIPKSTTPVDVSTNTNKSQSNSGTTNSSYTITQIAKHNLVSDCWIIINKTAYDVTSYLASHPGGADTIIPYCGKDATQAYDEIKGGRGHSTRAAQDLVSLAVGSVQ